MKYFKVWAKCCVSATPIKEVYEEDVKKEMEELVSYLMDEDSEVQELFEVNEDDEITNIDEIYDKLFEAIKKDFEKCHHLDCGDYEIIEKEDDFVDRFLIERPNMVGYPSYHVLKAYM